MFRDTEQEGGKYACSIGVFNYHFDSCSYHEQKEFYTDRSDHHSYNQWFYHSICYIKTDDH